MAKSIWTIEKNALAGLVLSSVLAVAMVWVVAVTLARLTHLSDQVVRSVETMEVVDSLLDHLVDVETGERGYIITGDAAYLAPHERGLAAVQDLRSKLTSLLDGELSGQELAGLDRRLEAKIAISRANVHARKLGFEAARARVVEGAGKRDMDALREILGRISQMQSTRRDDLRSMRNATMADLKRNMAIAAVMFIALLAYLHARLLQMIKAIRETEREAQHLAMHDGLTGLPNRRLMLEHLNQAFQRCVRHNNGLALLFLDLNGFKPVNDKYGHKAGDDVLKQVAHRLSGAVRASDRVARLGGDEFVVLAEGIAGKDDVCDFVRKINAEIERPILLKEWGEVAISTSIGVSIYPRDGQDIETLLRNADTAMYEAKRSGSNCYCKEQQQFRRCMARKSGGEK
jgi:diguanylate cyclase (GGDEF)-like protein